VARVAGGRKGRGGEEGRRTERGRPTRERERGGAAVGGAFFGPVMSSVCAERASPLACHPDRLLDVVGPFSCASFWPAARRAAVSLLLSLARSARFFRPCSPFAPPGRTHEHKPSPPAHAAADLFLLLTRAHTSHPGPSPQTQTAPEHPKPRALPPQRPARLPVTATSGARQNDTKKGPRALPCLHGQQTTSDSLNPCSFSLFRRSAARRDRFSFLALVVVVLPPPLLASGGGGRGQIWLKSVGETGELPAKRKRQEQREREMSDGRYAVSGDRRLGRAPCRVACVRLVARAGERRAVPPRHNQTPKERRLKTNSFGPVTGPPTVRPTAGGWESRCWKAS
jgi:hypothetical protein